MNTTHSGYGMDLEAHLAHLLAAPAEDRLALIRRVAAIAWLNGREAGLDWCQTDPDAPNPYAAN